MTSSVTNAISGAATAVGNALTLEPNVVPAESPVELSSMPGKVGPEVYVTMARVYEQQGNLAAAQDQYRRALQIAPNDPAIMVAYARNFDRQGDYQQAIGVYEQAVQANPHNALALNDLGLCLARQGNLQRSAQVLNRAVEADPRQNLYRNNIATVLAELGQFDQALLHLAAAHPPAIAHYNMGYLLQQRNQLARARHHFSQSLELDPSLAPARAMLARIGAPPQQPQIQAPAAAPPLETEHQVGSRPSVRTSSLPSQGDAAGRPGSPTTPAAQNWGQAPHPSNYGRDPTSSTTPQLLPPVN